MVLNSLCRAQRAFVPARKWLGWSNVVGLSAAALVCVVINGIAASSSRQRWDVTTDHRFTLTASSRGVLAAIKERVSVYVMISRVDPLAPLIKPWLDAYQSSSSRLNLNWTDPDREPAKFLALQARLGITAGAAKGGESLSDAVIVLERGGRRDYVTVEDLFHLDAESGEPEPRIEQALTGGIRRLFVAVRPVVCFTYGHRELSVEDRSPAGLSELKNLVQQNAMELRTIALEAGVEQAFSECKVVVVAEPEIAFSAWEKARISEYRDRAGSMWLLSGTVPDESGQVKAAGLDDLLPNMGVSLGSDVVVEQDERFRLTDGFGESFLASTEEHPITHALRRGDDLHSLRVLVSLSPSLKIEPGAQVQVLLRSSPLSHRVGNLSSYLSGSPRRHTDPNQVFTLAVAAELGNTPNGFRRRFVVSPGSLAVNRALRQPGLVGNRAFVDGVLNWLVDRPLGVESTAPAKDIPELTLTAADVKQINRYVLFVMPSAALALALTLFAVRRRGARKH